ncbi:SPASM domain-containing protein [Marinoscillum furvescens]|nr:radical SAM protein [Marinoscillum furvescens]
MYISVNDTLQLASKLTLKRLKNAWRIYRSYNSSRTSRKASISGMPISLSIEPTTSCNLRCPECPSGLRSFTRPTGMLSPELFRKVIDEIGDTLFYLLFYFQGEPYLHPDFLDLVSYAAKKNIYTATSTNAHYLSDAKAKATVASGLDRLIISIDGTTQETYEAYRKGGKLEKVLDGTERILHWRKKLKSRTPHVVWQFLVVRPNEHQIQEVEALAQRYGVDKVAFKTAQIYDYEKGNPLIPTLDKYARYKKQSDGTYRIKSKILNECWKMWHSCVMTWDGQIVPCCFDKDAAHPLGNLQTETFEAVWQSSAYQDFRQQLLQGRDQIEMCKNCTEGTKVWA